MLELPKLNLPEYNFRIRTAEGVQNIYCTFRNKWIVLKPEEWVRQNFARFMVEELGYPASRIKLEQSLKFKERNYLADIVVYDKLMQVSVLIECKKTDLPITQKTFTQIGIYNHGLGGINCLIVTNGLSHYCLELQNNQYEFLDHLPGYKN